MLFPKPGHALMKWISAEYLGSHILFNLILLDLMLLPSFATLKAASSFPFVNSNVGTLTDIHLEPSIQIQKAFFTTLFL